jgi:hypothetical protein
MGIEQTVAACQCGRYYSAEKWNELPKAGVQKDPLFLTELRNCPCKSTLGCVFAVSPEADTVGVVDLYTAIDELWSTLKEAVDGQKWIETMHAFREVELLRHYILQRVSRRTFLVAQIKVPR